MGGPLGVFGMSALQGSRKIPPGRILIDNTYKLGKYKFTENASITQDFKTSRPSVDFQLFRLLAEVLE